MENPEEVLQALEEFQKMRPTEIPRELDEYINFVAKTGDSVYQWPLVKPLFREKLVRVMTDFYESCPTLDLASSPNIEHFNYDIMKCNLLDLLESFANAPFTIQRLCELLTSPRKEYNRVDKFMRAIEKNILVVSTREPGRRSENGDSLLNGSIDEDISINQQQQSHEIEMEAWEKECTTSSTTTTTSTATTTTTTTTIESSSDITSLSTEQEQDVNITETIIQTKIINESNDVCQTVIQDKINDDILISTSQEILTTSTVLTDSSLPSIITDSIVCTTSEVDNITENINQVTEIVGDVTESIINEDTNSQPITDNDTNDNEKLQTTFHSKDFTDNVDNENVAAVINEDEKTDITEAIVDDNLINKVVDDGALVVTEETVKNQLNELSSNVADENEGITKVSCSVITTHHENKIEQEIIKSDDDKDEIITNDKDEELKTEETTIVKCVEETTVVESSLEVTTTCETSETVDNELKNNEVEKQATDVSKPPIIEEPVSEEIDKKEEDNQIKEEKNIVIQEAMDDDAKVTNSTVPEPIPIVEEPKDETSSSSGGEYTAAVVETVDESTISESNKQDASIDDTSVTTNIEIVEKNQPTESMEIDNDESMSVCQNDEPMEEESSYQTRS
ncbi:hypothetical protein HCN44_001562 [Aphidius gifuensis]|uniref:Serine/threonine-protein phosphatase 4 regulatory subunit 2 n=1 Tax=Aphidius gifuensis TaxID=684658 RepID=A0A835CQG5_APHGI|nr:serine/threonine-protein phosphatase 4 regulatory subunit 2-A [Aphidius gifuensis]KAF7992237.1 hypothetical protein HCN44_001562 [Aphidius gifuensis]